MTSNAAVPAADDRLRGESSSRSARRDPVADRLLAAAHDLLANEGPGALTVRRIATAAGVSTMNVYSRFGGKDGVIEELYIDGFQRLAAAQQAVQSRPGDSFDAMYQVGRAYRTFALENPTYYRVMFSSSCGGFEPSPYACEISHGTLAHCAKLAQRAIDEGVLATHLSAINVATALWSCSHGVLDLELGSTNDDRSGLDWETVADLAWLSMANGMRAQPQTPPVA